MDSRKIYERLVVQKLLSRSTFWEVRAGISRAELAKHYAYFILRKVLNVSKPTSMMLQLYARQLLKKQKDEDIKYKDSLFIKSSDILEQNVLSLLLRTNKLWHTKSIRSEQDEG